MGRRRRNLAKIFVGAFVFLVVVGVGVFFGAQWLTKTGIFRVPGVVYYDESLNTDELAILQGIFTDEVDLDKDVYISAKYVLERPENTEGEYVYNIYVPTTDFYDTNSNINEENPEILFADKYMSDAPSYSMVSIDDLSFSRKLLSLNGVYYLDNFDKGAVYRVIKFDSEAYEEEIEPLVSDVFSKEFPDKNTVLTFAQSGVTALSRGMNTKLKTVGDAKYFSQNIAEFLSNFDITHTSNESSFTEYASSENICSDPRFIDTLIDIGLDVVELTGNHNQDCGNTAAADTIDLYKEKGIRIVGGGKTADEAKMPLQIDEKGSNITMLAYNQSTGGVTLGNTPGANQYDEENAKAEITAAKARGDFVLVDIQYYECSSYDYEYENNICDYADSSAGDQVGFFRHLIELGADMVVGTSAHQPQTFELYDDGVIYYGLGNLFFDQAWWPGTTRSLILVNYFYKDKLLQTKIVPTVYDSGLQTKLLDEETATWFISRLVSERP